MSTRSKPNQRRVDVGPKDKVKSEIQFGKYIYRLYSVRLNPKIPGNLIALYVPKENQRAKS